MEGLVKLFVGIYVDVDVDVVVIGLGMTSVITSSDGVVIVVIEVCSNPNMTLKKKRSNIPPNTFL